MEEIRIEEKYFERLVEFPLAICKECRYAVWPDQVEGHLQGGNHKLSRKEAVLVGDGIRSWPGLIQYPSELELPGRVNQPIDQLPLY